MCALRACEALLLRPITQNHAWGISGILSVKKLVLGNQKQYITIQFWRFGQDEMLLGIELSL